MSQLTTNDVLSHIAISKNVIKEYKTSESDRTVYLDNGTEFQIHIKNPYQNHLGIDIYVNEKSIGNRLVLRPGQSVWLERFMNDDHKFLFETYEVEDTKETHYAINKNGKVTSASIIQGPSSTDSSLQEYALEAARRSRFSASSTAPASQQGEIVYRFIAQ